jgi:hypothetical protein
VSRLQTSFVLGYHGCDKNVGVDAVMGKVALAPSKGDFDWIGAGIYFWESDPLRALEWAQQKQKRGACDEPFVIGAAIDLGHCLDLLARENVSVVKDAYDSFKQVREKATLPMPVNKTAPKDDSADLVMRYLDCAVIDHLHSIIASSGGEAFDTVRAAFREGDPIYDGGMILDRNHAQLAVRNSKCIKGLFLPLGVNWPDGAANSPSRAG